MTDLYAKQIKRKASELGFMYCGISKATFLEKEAPRLESWLNKNYNGQMAYMANHFDKRLDPRKLVPGAKSVISFIYNYFPEQQQSNSEVKIAKYAYGEDYHFVLKDKIREVLAYMNEEIGEVNARVFVDSAPVMDKAWAAKSGAGWVGKNTNLISKQVGSFFFIGEIICDLELEPDGPVEDHCGTCTKCLDACPTDALVEPYKIDGSKCISYYTIELKEAIPETEKGKFEDWAFGCDICQDVCPWNRFSKAHKEPRFNINPAIESYSKKDWTELTEDVFNKVFKDSPLKRSKFEGIQRNLKFI